ncbi:HAD family hydrolase [Cerasicoccus arenae]|uniref:Beta-phosphoglucomutase n=1 Tax=Cerasicoccus arenae TaxID=424488 RepID=A0A8J3DBV8_9BACT|nr:HAD family phosphatase [Cerasicoccus arenae]MBK1857302.1 HAD family phosphatase [Cerasicoccus arenae]GHC00562.1 beta-phosphoglucomutase [Cerasicoccus arenae]
MNIGAIFDWDGVVIDSSAAHERSWELLAEEKGLFLPEDHFKKGFGRKNQFIIPNLLDWAHQPEEIEALSYRKEELYREIIKEKGIEALPGVRELLQFFKEKKIPCVVGTSTPRINAETIMDVIGVREYFVDITSAEDVNHGKPDPEVFLIAARKINREPARCLVFEDAHYGIEAGLRGGMKVVAVATTHPISDLHEAHMRVNRLSDLNYDAMLALVE